jgi:hypothetical protein
MEKNAHFDPLHFMSHHMIHKNKWDSWPHYPFGRVKAAICYGKPFKLDGYLNELDELRCPPVKDDDTAEEFLVAMGYLPREWPRFVRSTDMEPMITQAVKFFQTKKDVRPTGKLDAATLKLMNGTRQTYQLHLK